MPDLSLQANWIKIYDESYTIDPLPGTSQSLPALTFDIPFLSRYLKLFAYSTAVENGYSYAGSLSLYSGRPTQLDPIWITGRRCLLNNWRLLDLPEISNTQTSFLTWRSAHWLRDINLEIWQYQPEITTDSPSYEQRIVEQLRRIEDDLNSIKASS